MSSSFWSGYKGLTSFASGAISKAKEQIRDITTEVAIETSEDPTELKSQVADLENRCNEYNKILHEREAEFMENQKKLETLIEENRQHIRYIEELKEDNKEIVKFRIVIGAEDSVEALELLKVKENELNEEKEIKKKIEIQLEEEKNLRIEEKVKLMEILVLKENELNEYKQRYEEQGVKIVNLERNIQGMKDNEMKLKKEIENHKTRNLLLDEEIKSLKETMANQEETMASLQDSFMSAKKTQHQIAEECYKALKLSGGYIGLTVPNIKSEDIGIEDIAEFVSSQGDYMKETITRVATSLSLKTKGATERKITFKHTLEGIKEGVLSFVDEVQNKLKDTIDISKTTEDLYHKTLKEKIDLETSVEELKKSIENKEETIKTIENELKKDKADFSLIEELKNHNISLSSEIHDFKRRIEELEKQLNSEIEINKKSNEAYKSLDSHFASLIQKQKVTSNDLEEKEKQLKAAVDKCDELIKIIEENEILAEKNVSEIEEQHKKKINELKNLHMAEINDISQKHSKAIFESQTALAKAQNDCKELKSAKSQIEKYEEAIQKLQELLSSLENQVETYSSRIDDLTQELESMHSKLSHLSSKKKSYKQKLKETEIYIFEQKEEFKAEKFELEKQIQHTQQMKSEAEALVNQVQKQIQASDNLIDRRLITTFLLNYLNEQNSEKIRVQMLKALAGMLELNDEQKQKIGLVPDDGLLAQFANFISKG